MNIVQRFAARKTLETLATGLSSLRVGRMPLAPTAAKAPVWIFLGPPGVGKGTYASRVASALGVPHIAAGDLVRQQIKDQTDYGCKAQAIVAKGDLLPDEMILQLLEKRIEDGQAQGELGALLDGFPRTRRQAQMLALIADTQLAVNLSLRPEVLMAKCLGRRICKDCGKNFNVADIMLPASNDQPEVRMPPLNPPDDCREKMEIRSDDNLETVKNRIEVYNSQAKPVEEFFREDGLLRNFEISSGIPETLPRLLQELGPFSYLLAERRAQAARNQLAKQITWVSDHTQKIMSSSPNGSSVQPTPASVAQTMGKCTAVCSSQVPAPQR
ncbi:hypothetical protein ABBQ32_007327 [Trebouxia sp. C0010 RCD-2024]